MRSGKKKKFSCSHRGYGKYCHRCEQADTFEEMAKANKSFVSTSGDGKSKKWTSKEMLEEAKRLRNEGRR